MRIFLAITTLLAMLLAACASSNRSSYVVDSRDATTPEFAKLRFIAKVESSSERMYLLTVSSDEMNAAGFFAFCIAAYATAKAGYSRYVMGTKDPTEKVLGRSTLVFPTLLLKPGEKPEDVGPRGYKWGEVMDLANPIFRDSCSGMILPRYLW